MYLIFINILIKLHNCSHSADCPFDASPRMHSMCVSLVFTPYIYRVLCIVQSYLAVSLRSLLFHAFALFHSCSIVLCVIICMQLTKCMLLLILFNYAHFFTHFQFCVPYICCCIMHMCVSNETYCARYFHLFVSIQ